jgi:hypothetical protein
VIGFVLLLSFTFLPTTAVAVLSILGCAVGYALTARSNERARPRTVLSTLALNGLAVALACSSLGVIYLPFLESIQVTGLLDEYSSRVFFPASLTSALSLFTPHHFFDSSWLFMEPESAKLAGNTIYHFGVLGIVAAACAWRPADSRMRVLAWVCFLVVAMALGRIFGVPGISDLVGLIPVARGLGEQYLWVGAVVPMTLLVALGVDSLYHGVAARIPATLAIASGVVAGAVLADLYGLRPPDVDGKLTAIAIAALLGLVGLLVLWLMPSVRASRRGVMTSLIVLLLFVELAADAKWFRFEANDIVSAPTSEVPFLQMHVGNNRTMTLGAYATTLDRAGAYGLQEITSLNDATLPEYRDYFNSMTRALPQQYRMGKFVSLAYPHDAPNLNYFDWSLVNLLGVRYVIVPKTSVGYLQAFEEQQFRRVHDSQFTVVFENPRVLPRAFTVDVAADGDHVTLPADLSNRITPATITEYRNTQVEIAGSAVRPQLLVLTDNWHANWRAFVNGSPAPIELVNGTFRGVWVPAGAFTVEMSYQPRTLTLAILISALSGLFLIGCIGYRRPLSLLGLSTGTRR